MARPLRAGLLAYRKLGKVIGLTTLVDDVLADNRATKNGWRS